VILAKRKNDKEARTAEQTYMTNEVGMIKGQ
jgi:hypothetical protein